MWQLRFHKGKQEQTVYPFTPLRVYSSQVWKTVYALTDTGDAKVSIIGSANTVAKVKIHIVKQSEDI